MTPQEKLLKHEDLINLVTDHGYIPHKSQLNFREVMAAVKEIAPGTKTDLNCSGCIEDIIRVARVHLKVYKDKLAKERQATITTFPKHKKK